MKYLRSILVVVVVALQPTLSHSQAGTINLYADNQTTVFDDGPAVLSVSVIHENVAELDAVMFSVFSSSGFGGVWIDDTPQFQLTAGTSQTGVSILLGSCLTSPIHLMTVTYLLDGTSGSDSYLEVTGHPNSPQGLIEGTPCSGITVFPEGGRLLVNPSASAAEAATWGRVKALYRQ